MEGGPIARCHRFAQQVARFPPQSVGSLQRQSARPAAPAGARSADAVRTSRFREDSVGDRLNRNYGVGVSLRIVHAKPSLSIAQVSFTAGRAVRWKLIPIPAEFDSCRHAGRSMHRRRPGTRHPRRSGSRHGKMRMSGPSPNMTVRVAPTGNWYRGSQFPVRGARLGCSQ